MCSLRRWVFRGLQYPNVSVISLVAHKVGTVEFIHQDVWNNQVYQVRPHQHVNVTYFGKDVLQKINWLSLPSLLQALLSRLLLLRSSQIQQQSITYSKMKVKTSVQLVWKLMLSITLKLKLLAVTLFIYNVSSLGKQEVEVSFVPSAQN